jgi:16S rRNA (guanine(966)-N(2))-methyltransferase RsmD
MKAETKPGRIRIIGGQYRRTPIPVVAAPGLRPTPDRVRETVFNWLEHLLGGFAGRAVLDLFAGSGALGFEAASRGAHRVVLVDSHPRAIAALQALQQRLGAAAVEVVPSDWRVAAARQAPASFDLVFLDPPFGAGLLPEALAAARRIVRPDGLLYVESGQTAAGDAPAGDLEVVRSGTAGAVAFRLLRLPAQ